MPSAPDAIALAPAAISPQPAPNPSWQRQSDWVVSRLDELDTAAARELLSRTRHRAAFAGVPPTPEAAAIFLSYT
jgi:hypothetical protein